MSDVVDHFFPPMERCAHANDFSSVKYWRQPFPYVVDVGEEGGEETPKASSEKRWHHDPVEQWQPPQRVELYGGGDEAIMFHTIESKH